MTTIRELFHEVGNWHNKISVAAGVAKATLKQKTNSSASAEIQDMLEKLSEIEQHALGADKALRKLKGIIYEKMNPDSTKPRK